VPTDIPALTDADNPPALSLEQLLLGSLEARSLSAAQIQQLSPAALAYLGDAIYELVVRRHYLFPPQKIQAYHRLVVGQVRAEMQAIHLQTLTPHLTPTELNWVKRGRNAAANRPRRVEPEIYQQATSLETLIGYLYLTDAQRLTDLLKYLDFTSAQSV